MKGQPIFTPEPVEFNSYELCNLAGEFVNAKGKPDYSVAEMSYVDNDAGAGFAKVFVSHYQAELITQTIAALEIFEKTRCEIKYFLDAFCIRQGVAGDFKLDYVKKVITKNGLTLMVADPWVQPDTIKRIWHAFEILCTVEGDTELSVTIPDKDELRLMQEKSDEHTLLYERVCDILKGINVEKAGARNPKDRQHLHFALRVLS